jgi:methyl-accepting chemotaxis protein
MVEEPDRIRDDIELTRAQLAHDVDRLADKTSPSRVAQRGWASTKAKVRGVTDRVMGTAHDGGTTMKDKTSGALDTVKDKASSAVDTVKDTAGDVAGPIQQAPTTVRRQAQGNPIAVGLIAFGAGMLAGSLLPATDLEKRAGRQVREHADELIEPVRQPLTETAKDLGDSAKEAAASVRDTAKHAARTTAESAKGSAKDAATEVRQNVGS